AWVGAEVQRRWGGDPARLYVGGHSSGAMLALTSGCRAQSPVAGIVPIGGRYGMHQGSAILGGVDPVIPASEWHLPRVPAQAVIAFSEQEADGDEEPDDPRRLGDCARIGRSLARAMAERACEVTVAALAPMGHWQTVSTLGDAGSETGRATLRMIGSEG
ncbi:MAG: hypothetical protein WAU75_09325, partial [Solirubrobacteraceae bacterium]